MSPLTLLQRQLVRRKTAEWEDAMRQQHAFRRIHAFRRRRAWAHRRALLRDVWSLYGCVVIVFAVMALNCFVILVFTSIFLGFFR